MGKLVNFMKKKIISLVVLCVLALSAEIYYYIHQPKNIFRISLMKFIRKQKERIEAIIFSIN